MPEERQRRRCCAAAARRTRATPRWSTCCAQAAESVGLPADVVNLVPGVDHESVKALLRLRGLVDLIIPRGGAGLIRTVVEESTVPVIETGVGNCHIYVDADADLEMALRIVLNAKTSRPSVCNAAETVLVHRAVAPDFLAHAAAGAAAPRG